MEKLMNTTKGSIVMNYKKMSLYFLLFLSVTQFCHADNRIVIQLRQAPDAVKDQVVSQISKKTSEDSENLTQKVNLDLSGFIALYGGYWTRSTKEGSIAFPLRHASKKLYLAITPKIELLKPKGDTVSHKKYNIDPNNPTKLYLFEQKEDTKDTQTGTGGEAGVAVDAKGKTPNIFWSIKEVPLPQGNIIDPLTLIILSDPKNFVIDTTDQKATPNPQLVIPDLFVVGNNNKAAIEFETMDITRYFEYLQTDKKPADPTQEPTLRNLIKNP